MTRAPAALASVIAPRIARVVLILLAALILGVLATLPDERTTPGAGGAATVAGIVEGMRQGDGFYRLAAGAVRGTAAAALSALSVPLPTLATIAAALPFAAITAMLWMLAGAVVLAWQPLIAREASGRAQYLATLAALAGGCASIVRPSLALAPELWAGLLVALSLARRRAGDPTESIGFGIAATVLAPAAALHPLLMAGLAWKDGRRREAAGWIGALALPAIVLIVHARALSALAEDGIAQTAAAGAPGVAAAAIASATVLAPLPTSIGAALVTLAVAGWIRWEGDAGRRSAAVLLGYGTLIALVGDADLGDGRALLVAPVALVGLAFVPDLLRDLVRAALDRRRITVRRVVR